MLSPEDQQAVATTTRLLKIIIIALIAGPASYLIFVMTQPPPDPGPGPAPQSMTPIAAGFAALQIVLAVVVPQIIGVQHRKAVAQGRHLGKIQPPAMSDAQALLGGLQVRRIIAAALLEGAAFFNIVAYQLERRSLSAGIAVALLVGSGMLFPLRTLIEPWLERELRTVRELRELSK